MFVLGVLSVRLSLDSPITIPANLVLKTHLKNKNNRKKCTVALLETSIDDRKRKG